MKCIPYCKRVKRAYFKCHQKEMINICDDVYVN
jgi:hypothetical protein